MSLSDIKPEKTQAHEMVVTDIIDKEKEFPTREGVKMKYVIKFSTGYAAEYCPLKARGFDNRIKIGQKLLFRIAYRKDWGDEIEPYTAPANLGSKAPQSSFDGVVINVGGHPANVAINYATQIYTAKIAAGVSEETYGISDMQADADLIMKWIIDKVKNPEE